MKSLLSESNIEMSKILDLTFIKQITSYIGMFVPFINKRIYSKEKFLKDIQVTSGKPYTIECLLNCEQPDIRICLQVINLSQYLDIEIDTITIKQLKIRTDKHYWLLRDKDKKLGKKITRKSVEPLYITFELLPKQVEIITSIKQFYNVEADLYAAVFVESSLYKEKLDICLESIPCKLSLRKFDVFTNCKDKKEDS